MIAGINVDGINSLINEIYEYAEKLKGEFNSIESELEYVKEFYNCSATANFSEKVQALKQNFTILNNNILDYTKDFSKIKKNYRERMAELSTNLKKVEK